MTAPEKKLWIDSTHRALSIAAQCKLIQLPRSSYYYEPIVPSAYDLLLMKRADEIYTQWPFYGSRKILEELRKEGHNVNRKRIQGIMRTLGLEGKQPGPNTSKARPEYAKFPYLLRDIKILGPLQVWSTDITYIRLKNGFVYLVAVMDWFSRLVLSHRLSNSLDTTFCLEAFEEAIEAYGRPGIFNTDQGVQFTSQEFVDAVLSKGIHFSMDGRGRALDNIFVERLWRSVKYEDVYLRDYQDVKETRMGLGNYFRFYNTQRLHQSLGYKTPYEVHYTSKG